MQAVKIVEVLAESEMGWEEAAQEAVKHVARTVHGIKSVWVENFQGVVKDNKIVMFRVNVKISFVVDE